MRFIEDGPDIPDELLLALDEERVVFFCGAGVSQAGAELPGFLELAELVLADLRVLPTEPVHQILNIAKPNKEPLPTPVSADLIFGELEKDFYPQDIQASVAKNLITENGMKPTAHSDLVKLATTHDGHTRLVTTNFDRLFENCAPDIKTWQYPNLPDLTKDTEFEGLVYLHGRVNEQYRGCDEEFILSTAEFGRAYLAEGSATRFFKQIIAEYTVVFVGYGAEDPPVRYLLEAFNKEKPTPKDKNKIYAFQSGTPEEANKKWANRGVTVIPYDEADKHKALWNTFSEWVVRTKTTEAWQDGIMKMAVQGPEGLLPFDREKVLQMVATEAGAKRFGADNNPPPATWLNVFNFEPNYRDKCEAGQENMVSLIGTQTPSAGKLPHRFYTLGNWIASVSDQPAAVWWAVRQAEIHPDVQGKIKEALGRKTNCPPYIKLAWQYIFDSWSPNPDDRSDYHPKWYSFESDLGRLGWDATMVRRYEELTKPRMVAKPNFTRDEIPPQKDAKTDFAQLVDLDIWYNNSPHQIKIPNECLVAITAVWRRNLDIAVRLEVERDYYFPINTSIAYIDDSSISGIQNNDGLAGAVLYYTFLFKRLLEYDLPQAKAEFQTWDKEDYNVYARLRIWSARFVEIVADDDFGNFFTAMPQKVFWDFYHQRDLLYMIKARWMGMSVDAKRYIGKQILQGDEKYEREKQDKYIKRRAWGILERLDWLKENGCILEIDYDKEIARLKEDAPDYKIEQGQHAADSRHSGVRVVMPDTDASALLGLPILDILPKAEKITFNNNYSLDYNIPFSGLCKNHPRLALLSLCYEAKRSKFRSWAWRDFLHDSKRKDDSERMKRFTAELINRMPDEEAIIIINPLASWLLCVSEKLLPDCFSIFEKLAKRFIKILPKNPESANFSPTKGNENRNWITDANSSVSADIINALLNHPYAQKPKFHQSFVPDWLRLIEALLSVPDDAGRYAFLTCTRNLDLFHRINSKWTHDNILQPLFKENSNIKKVWWVGYLRDKKLSPTEMSLPNLKLFKKIKPYLLERASNQDIKEGNDSFTMAQFILLNWDKNKNRISDEEFRAILRDTSDGLRTQILWNIESFCKNDPHPPHWKEKRRHLFENVWPLHIRAKTPHTIGKLISFAFVDDPAFPQMSKTILRLLGQEISQGSIHSFLYGTDNKNTVDKHPKVALEILYRIVPEDAFWDSHRIKEILDRIATADPELTRDPRFKELQRRWAAR